MLKYAAIFLVLSIIAGAMGFVTVSQVARRISLVLFGIFFAIALAVVGFFVLLERATASELTTPALGSEIWGPAPEPVKPAKPVLPPVTRLAEAGGSGPIFIRA
ncbi:DUF1328 domain-containing protein [Xanthobacteraceae bacterium A53D]